MTILNFCRSGMCLCSFTIIILPYQARSEWMSSGLKGGYGKIGFCMNINEPILDASPPRLFPTLLKGFNTVAGRVQLILIPLLLDLFLWLGPKLRVHDLFVPILNELSTTMLKIAPQDLLETVNATSSLYIEFLEQFNLFTFLRTFPIGIPSLLARIASLDSPLDLAGIIEVPSFRIGIAILGGLLLAGFFLGTLFFNSLSRLSLDEPAKFDWKQLFSHFTQALIFFLILIALLTMISIPVFIILSILSLVSAPLAQFVLLGMIFLLIWMALPLVFSPHGIFALDQKVVPSMLLSMRMVRFFLPGTSLFIIFCILISEGFNLLWALPGTGSWLLALGIGGHAFIVTGLLCASFVYYREGLKWMQFNIQKMQKASRNPESGGTTVEQ